MSEKPCTVEGFFERVRELEKEGFKVELDCNNNLISAVKEFKLLDSENALVLLLSPESIELELRIGMSLEKTSTSTSIEKILEITRKISQLLEKVSA